MEHINLNEENTKAMDDVSAWLSDAKSSEYGFLKAAYMAIVQFEKGNRDPLAKLLTVTQGKKAKRLRIIEGNKMVFAAPLKRLCQVILPNVKAKHNPGSDFGMQWTVDKSANTPVDMEKLDVLRQLAGVDSEGKWDRDNAVSPFGKNFKEAFPAFVKEGPTKTEGEIIKAKAESLRKWAEKEGIKLDYLVYALTAKPQNEEPAH